jgi:serine/threonine protein kinase
VGGGESRAFAGYQLLGPVAAGGMASVYLARAEGGDPEDYLAVKRVHPHLTSRADVRQMFLNEARILSRLEHPNICGILDYGVADDTPYLVMQYLHGAPLSGLLRRLLDVGRPFPVDLMAYVVACTAEGLHYAHEARGEDGQPLALVHRDISPQNIFVTFSGEVKLLDFGVAKAAGFDGLTRTGHVKGKYAYMSPEQAEGQGLDHRSDVFSLGIVLWEAFTGRHLFKRKREIETLRAITAGVVPLPSTLNRAVPPELDRILQRTLQTRRERRYQSAAALAEALWSYLTTTVTPMGSDEVAEILSEVFADQPAPAEQAMRMLTDPEAPVATSPGALPLEDLEPSVIEDATAAALLALERDTEDPLEAPTGEAPMASPGPATDAVLALGQDAAPALIPWAAERAEHAATVADPRLGAEVRRAIAEATPEPEGPTGPEALPSRSFLDRPLLQPHPFDAEEERETLPPEQETLMDGAPPPGVPQAEISDVRPELSPAGPEVEPAPSAVREAPRSNATEPAARPPSGWAAAGRARRRESERPPARPAPWGLAVALAAVAAALVVALFSLQ